MKNAKKKKQEEAPKETKVMKAYIWSVNGSYFLRKYNDGIPEEERNLPFSTSSSEMIGPYLNALRTKLKSEGYLVFGRYPPSP